MRFAFTLAALLLAACGGGEKGAAGNSAAPAVAQASAGASACDVLTQADAERALGHKVEKLPAAGGAAGYDICQYGWEGEHIADTGNVSVTVHPNPIADFRKSVAASGMKIEDVPGLGDDAFWAENLYVGKGNRTAFYEIGGKGVSDPKAAAIALAQATLSRL